MNRWILALALVAALPAAGQGMPDKQLHDAVLAQCYSANGRDKRIYDLAQEIGAANQAIADGEAATPRDEALLAQRRRARDDLFRRYKDLGGKGGDFADAPALSKDPCAHVKKMLANPPATPNKQ